MDNTRKVDQSRITVERPNPLIDPPGTASLEARYFDVSLWRYTRLRFNRDELRDFLREVLADDGQTEHSIYREPK